MNDLTKCKKLGYIQCVYVTAEQRLCLLHEGMFCLLLIQFFVLK